MQSGVNQRAAQELVGRSDAKVAEGKTVHEITEKGGYF